VPNPSDRAQREELIAAEHLVGGLVASLVGEVEIQQIRGKPAASIRPRSPTDIRHLVHIAARHGGRVAVTRRLRPGLLAIDLATLATVEAPDEKTCLIRVGAGARVRDVEARAIQAGLTLGPLLPSSMNKTVGAWLAGPTRGERTIPPGRLETAALALGAVTADGSFYKSKETPRSATGPDLDHLLLGGEGRFGIITRATLRLMPRNLLEASAAKEAASALEAIEAILQACRRGLAPAEARWDRSHGIVEARFMGNDAASHARHFGDTQLVGHDIIRGPLELAGSWRAWAAASPLRPQGLHLVALSADGAFGAVELESADEAPQAAKHAQAIGLTIVSPRALRPSPDVGWSGGAASILHALEAATDPTAVLGR
jgi:FAD/FMN-containing dehydrogenase